MTKTEKGETGWKKREIQGKVTFRTGVSGKTLVGEKISIRNQTGAGIEQPPKRNFQ